MEQRPCYGINSFISANTDFLSYTTHTHFQHLYYPAQPVKDSPFGLLPSNGIHVKNLSNTPAVSASNPMLFSARILLAVLATAAPSSARHLRRNLVRVHERTAVDGYFYMCSEPNWAGKCHPWPYTADQCCKYHKASPSPDTLT